MFTTSRLAAACAMLCLVAQARAQQQPLPDAPPSTPWTASRGADTPVALPGEPVEYSPWNMPAAVPAMPAPPAAPVLPETALSTAPPPLEEACPPPKIWEGGVELGINGTDGNSESLNLRSGGKIKRKTDRNISSLDIDYHRNSNASAVTANRAFLEGRSEWLFQNSPFTWFVHGTVDYDEFAAFDTRLAADTGLGYRLIKSETTTLTGRFGAGVSHEINSPDERYVPEAVFGMEFEHKLSRRQKLSFSTEYTPAWADFNDFRLYSKAAWEVLLDEERHLSLKAAALDRYDSTPQGKKPNDIEYSLMLLWGF